MLSFFYQKMALFSAKFLIYFKKCYNFVTQIRKFQHMNSKILKALTSGSNTLLLIDATDLKEFVTEVKKTLSEIDKRKPETHFEDNQKNYFTAQEVCRMLSVSMPTLWRWAKAGYLLPIMMGSSGRKKRLFRKSDVDKILNNR